MGGMNQQANGARNGPCVMSTACTVIPTSKSVCEDNEGVWWGADHTDTTVIPNPDGNGYLTCAAVNQALSENGKDMLNLVPESSVAIRNERYKLVRNTSEDYVPATKTFETETVEELFEISDRIRVSVSGDCGWSNAGESISKVSRMAQSRTCSGLSGRTPW